MNMTFSFLGNTIMLTVITSTLITLSMVTDHWEYVRFDRKKVQNVALQRNMTVTWLQKEKVAKIVDDSGEGLTKFFLVPLYGGVWHICLDISVELEAELRKEGLKTPSCLYYLMKNRRPSRRDWVGRMQNLSISCAMVSLILLGVSALVGIFGIIRSQLSALLVTGVMYILAGLFGIFTLTIMHFKRTLPMIYPETKIDIQNPASFLSCRIFSNGWSTSVGWTGVTLSIFTSLMWIVLSKLMR